MKTIIIIALLLSALVISACGRGPMYDNGSYRTLPADAPDYMTGGGRHNNGGYNGGRHR